jgi:hypothetical protein
MKKLLFLVPLLTVFVRAQAASPAQPFSITISGPEEVKAGADIEINIQLTNSSDHEINLIEFYENGVNLSYSYDVRDEKGVLREKKSKRRSGGSVKPRTVKVGESIEAGTLVSRVFDMSQPGQYVIQVSHAISDDPKNAVKSNSITVKVAP